MKCHLALLAAAAATLLVACGDNPADAPAMPAPPDTSVPASATASPLAYSQYAASLKPSETAMPLDVNQVTPPTSETESPASL